MAGDWQTKTLGSLVSFKTGKLDSNAAVEDGLYPFFTCSQETLRTNTYSFDTECVLLAGNNANGIFPLKYFKGKFDAYQRTYIVKPLDTEQLSTSFLYYALRPKLSELRSISTGAATKFLTLTILNATSIDVPPIRFQKQIAEMLSAYDELIEVNQRRIQVLEEMARSLYREWFVHFRFPGHENHPRVPSTLSEIPRGWEVKRLGDILELAYGKALKADQRNGGNIPVYGSSGVVGHHDIALTTGPGLIVGRKGNVGSIAWSDSDFFVIDTAFYVKSNLPMRFLLHALHGKQFLNSDAAVPGLNREQAYSLEQVVPPVGLVDDFSRRAESLGRLVSVLSKQIDCLRDTRDLLLPRLLSGQIKLETN
jgi:type I restriction enzyme S subunit